MTKHSIHLTDEVGTLHPDCPDCQLMIRPFVTQGFENVINLLKAHVDHQVAVQLEEKMKDWEPEHTINLKVSIDEGTKLRSR